jgi:hypothetical protein
VLTSVLGLVDPSVFLLREELRRAGLLADVCVMFVLGEPDVRLVACRDGEDLSVELLVSVVSEPTPDHWQAVRVRADLRHVWQGPRQGCPAAEVVRFVEALLSVPPDGAADHYTVLG